MKRKTLWLTWLYLFAFCCILGFIPDPPEAVKALLVVLGVGFFVPGALLLKTKDQKTVGIIRLISIISLVLTLINIILNFASALMSHVWGKVFYVVLGILSTPMFCCQFWIISLFGWALLMSASFFIKK